MLRYTIRRIPSAFATLAIASIAIFACVRLLPGDPARTVLGADATPDALARLHHQMGLDQPIVVQYLTWLAGVATGHLGSSYITGASISQTLAGGAVPTMELAVAAMIVTVIVGFTLGSVAALGRTTLARAAARTLYTLLIGTPEYVFAVLGVLVLAVGINLLPAGGRVSLSANFSIGVQYLILPAVSLGLHSGAVVGRFLDSSLQRTMEEPFIEAAQAKGISRRQLTWRHSLPNAVPTVLTVLGLRLGHLLGGAVVIEAIFNWHGLGQVLIDAVSARDYRIVQDLVLFAVLIFIVVQVLTDLAQAALDPRARESLVEAAA